MLASSLGIPLFPLRRAIDFAMTAPSDPIDVLRVNGERICLIGSGCRDLRNVPRQRTLSN